MIARQVRLDPHADNIPPFGWTVVSDQVGFIQHALEGGPLFVRGEELCGWAEDFGEGRAWETIWLRSPTQELLAQCPDLSQNDAAEALASLSDDLSKLDRPLRLVQILGALWRETDLWGGETSPVHAFRWLLWLATQDSVSGTHKLAFGLARGWEANADPELRRVYTARTKVEAQELVKEWLGVSKSEQAWPASPEYALNRSIANWLEDSLRSEAVRSDTDFFTELVERTPKLAILRLGAHLCASVLANNPGKITEERLRRLEPYLPPSEAQELKSRLPVPVPGLPNWRFNDFADWFRDNYLPYRAHIASQVVVEPADEWVHREAAGFASSFLSYYAALVAGHEDAKNLAFARSGQLRTKSAGWVVLLVVLDGLGYLDGLELIDCLGREAARLDLDESGLVLAPLPTVTEFAKVSVARGVLPAAAQNLDSIAIHTSAADVAAKLMSADAGDVLVWAMAEPDHTYHYPENRAERAIRLEVHSRIGLLAKQISEVVRLVADEVHLRVVVTADHGRLLRSVQRTRPVPPGMVAHGRAAWGASSVRVGEQGFHLEDGIAYLHAGRFGLPDGQLYCALIADEAFRTSDDRAGLELYPHGGLLPEEILIPWIEYTRDRKPPQVDTELTGKGEAGKPGQARLLVRNLGSVRVDALHLVVQPLNQRVQVNVPVEALSEKIVEIELPLWPTEQQLESLKAEVVCRLPNGGLFRQQCPVRLQSEALYVGPDSGILDALGGL